MYDKDFQDRLAKLRCKKGVSARDMSLSIGQNAGYINNIETGKALHSMSGFFYICEYLNISPKEFFDEESDQPEKLRKIISNLKNLDDNTIEAIEIITEKLSNSK